MSQDTMKMMRAFFLGRGGRGFERKGIDHPKLVHFISLNPCSTLSFSSSTFAINTPPLSPLS